METAVMKRFTRVMRYGYSKISYQFPVSSSQFLVTSSHFPVTSRTGDWKPATGGSKLTGDWKLETGYYHCSHPFNQDLYETVHRETHSALARSYARLARRGDPARLGLA